MAKKIYLTEEQFKNLAQVTAIGTQTQYPYSPENVLIVKEFLDSNFGKSSKFDGIGENGLPSSTPIVIYKNIPQGEGVKSLYDYQLLEILNSQFDYMFTGRDEKQRFLSQVLRDWYNDKIGSYGSLSVNFV